jgi:hypothetical protein
MKRVVILPVKVVGSDRLEAQLSDYGGPVTARVLGFVVPLEQHGLFLVRRPMVGVEALFSVPEWTPVGQLTPDVLRGLSGFDLGWVIMGSLWRMEFQDTTGGRAVPRLNLAFEEVTNQEWNARAKERRREEEER